MREFCISRSTLKFITNPLTANVTDLIFPPFSIDSGAFELKICDLKNKELWVSKFEKLSDDLKELERNKSTYFYIPAAMVNVKRS